MIDRSVVYLATGAALASMAVLMTSPARAVVSGKAIALQGAGSTPACASCHGQGGEGNVAAGFPRLAGQPVQYLQQQLRDFASGARANPVMQPIASQLSDAEMAAVSRYYAGLTTPSENPAKASPAVLSQGRELVVNGQWNKAVPACITCHGPGARGIAPHFPALAGQSANYIESQIEAWQAGKRDNDPNGLMLSVAQALSEDQAHAAAVYLASLPATGPIPESCKPDVAPAQPDALSGYFQPPLRDDLPTGEFGRAVRRGEQIFTQTHASPASKYIGDGLDCANCHVNSGRQAQSAPLWAAWVLYPKYRSKNHKINTMAERIRGCFTFSENAQASAVGHAPPLGNQILIDLQSYMYWLATNAPTGKKMKGQGYPELPDPPQPFDRERGRQVFADNCAICHGEEGQGTKLADGSYAFPPLWGAHSFNWGAGMHRVNTAASFIKANMPLGKPDSLSLQQAWDVAAFIDSQPRPQDPRFKGDLDETARQYHGKDIDYYGQTVDGRKLGAPNTLKRWQSQQHEQ